MSEKQKSLPVWSNNEWDPLEEIIVGDCFNYNIPDPELSFKKFFHDNTFSYSPFNFKDEAGRPAINVRYIEETQEDLVELCDVISALGVRVRRPIRLDDFHHFSTPYWESTCSAPYSVRDQVLIIGDEIIETPPLLRCRYFENDLLKQTLMDYFRRGARWTSAPRPMMLDRSYDFSYIEKQGVDIARHYPLQASKFDIGHEIMFDAAQLLRFGTDLLMNVSNENHELGAQWLERHLGSKYKIHRVNVADDHIDSIYVPLRPGTLLVRDPVFFDKLPAPLQQWDIIYPPKIDTAIFPDYGVKDLMLASKYIDTNVLSVDGDKIIVNSLYEGLCHELECHGFTPVPVRLRHRRLFSGGFHCVTLDIRRRGKLEKYF